MTKKNGNELMKFKYHYKKKISRKTGTHAEDHGRIKKLGK
jgi:hypothetical protein